MEVKQELGTVRVPWRRHWWQFWKKKYVYVKVPKIICDGLTVVKPVRR